VNGRQLSAAAHLPERRRRAVRPDLAGIDTVQTLDNVSVMELETTPRHLVIVAAATSAWSSRS
jgi:hypothetical protein